MEQIRPPVIKKLQQSDIYHHLSFPAAGLHNFQKPEGAHRMAFQEIDYTGNAWIFCLSTRLNGLYLKPVLLRSSWHPFVLQKGLNLGDRVTLYWQQDEANIMRVRVRAQRRIMTLMGQDVWVDVENLHLYNLEKLEGTAL